MYLGNSLKDFPTLENDMGVPLRHYRQIDRFVLIVATCRFLPRMALQTEVPMYVYMLIKRQYTKDESTQSDYMEFKFAFYISRT